MALDTKDLTAIQKLVQKLLLPIESKIVHLEDRMEERFQAVDARFDVVDARFREVDANFDALFKRDETHQQEYLVITGQMTRLEKRMTNLERKIA